ncbi:hypothetical protein KJ855_04820, partial [Patescibacteria group bacterium]|nr:hypothetical protein [Patescibacteria group bacterium]
MTYLISIWLGKIVKNALRLFGYGATALPGLVSYKIDPDVLTRITSKLKHGSVLVTGTNGKTTTSRIISAILDRHGYAVVGNRSGSNLERGLISTLLDVSNFWGEVEADVAVLEVDEADLVNIINKVSCKHLVVLNFFRDQLDRYGELMSLRNLIKKAILEMPAGSRVVLCADDPLVVSLTDDVPQGVEVSYFGLDIDIESENNFAVDVSTCVKCGGDLKYNKVYLSHLGNYRCGSCGFARGELDYAVTEVKLHGIEKTEVVAVLDDGSKIQLEYQIPGLFNVYNLLAALAVVSGFDIDNEVVVESVAKIKPAFGRFEKIDLDGKEVILMLSKNP